MAGIEGNVEPRGSTVRSLPLLVSSKARPSTTRPRELFSMAIRTDEATGLKIFNTRAAKATEKIAGKGYSAINDDTLKTLPPPPPGAVFNAEEQARYRAFKEARRGAADYIAMEGEFAKYLEDVYSAPPIQREPLTDECEILVVGAGFAGLLLWYKLRDAGFHDVRFCEKGGDVGGTWYWNR
jgi:cyclohexanone monooxygenase